MEGDDKNWKEESDKAKRSCPEGCNWRGMTNGQHSFRGFRQKSRLPDWEMLHSWSIVHTIWNFLNVRSPGDLILRVPMEMGGGGDCIAQNSFKCSPNYLMKCCLKQLQLLQTEPLICVVSLQLVECLDFNS